METSRNRIPSILLADEPSAHERLANCLRRRCPGPYSLGASSEEPGFARVTVTFSGNDAGAAGCRLQVEKLIDVAEATLLDEYLEAQFVLMRLEVPEEAQRDALGMLDRMGGKVLRKDERSFVAQLGDLPERVEAALADLRTFGPMTVMRSGTMAMAV